MSDSMSPIPNAVSTVDSGGYLFADAMREPKTDLGEDEFMQLLVAQLSNQDPMEPMEDTEFIAQMAQFSSLEQMQALNKAYEVSRAENMIGKTAVASTTILNADGEYEAVDLVGIVSGTVNRDGETYLAIGDYLVPIDSVSELYDTVSTDNMILQGGVMVGKYVNARTYDAAGNIVDINGLVEKITVEGGRVFAVIGEDKVAISNIVEVSDKPLDPLPEIETEEDATDGETTTA